LYWSLSMTGSADTVVWDGFETGDFSAWSSIEP
jgi:hypothetical protein